MKNKFLATLFLACSISTVSAQTPVYMDDAQPIEARVKDALSRMTLEEKVALCHAQSKFSSAGVPRLGIPELWMSDRFPGFDLSGRYLESGHVCKVWQGHR